MWLGVVVASLVLLLRLLFTSSYVGEGARGHAWGPHLQEVGARGLVREPLLDGDAHHVVADLGGAQRPFRLQRRLLQHRLRQRLRQLARSARTGSQSRESAIGHTPEGGTNGESLAQTERPSVQATFYPSVKRVVVTDNKSYNTSVV
eukprot:3995308-Pyramimonas_sp.AAC.2